MGSIRHAGLMVWMLMVFDGADVDGVDVDGV